MESAELFSFSEANEVFSRSFSADVLLVLFLRQEKNNRIIIKT